MSDALRSEFPVLSRTAYLNAGTNGPVPARAAAAAVAALRRETAAGRAGPNHWERIRAAAERLRAAYARWLGCDAADVALTGSTTDGVNTALLALGLRRGDEVVTSDEEHPGLLAPLASARERVGIAITVAPFGRLADAVGARTRLVACSHVSWVSGRVADTGALAATGVPLLLDGAQGLGAIPVGAPALGCDFYAASGQKWLCGPDRSGCLYVRRDRIAELAVPWPGYSALADPTRALGLVLRAGAARFDLFQPPQASSAWALAAIEVLERAGRDIVQERGPRLAARFAERLADAGRDVIERGPSTLVSWRSEDPEREVERLAAAGVVVRELPGRGLVRASVGAWSNEDDLERLLAATSSSSR